MELASVGFNGSVASNHDSARLSRRAFDAAETPPTLAILVGDSVAHPAASMQATNGKGLGFIIGSGVGWV